MTTLKCHSDIKRRATGTILVSMERGGPYLSSSLTLKNDQGVPRDPRCVFCEFNYIRLSFFDRYFF